MALEHDIPYLPRRLKLTQVYQIWTPPTFNLVWSILLPLLVPREHAVPLRKRIRLVLGSRKDILEYKAKHIIETVPSIDEVEKCLLLYNPFTNSVAIFKRRVMHDMAKIFTLRLRLVMSRFGFSPLDAAATILGTRLDLHVECVRFYPTYYYLPLSIEGRISNPMKIVLLQENVQGEDVFSFTVGMETCAIWRLETLGSLLRVINLPEDGVDRVLEKIGDGKSDLLVCLLTDPHDKDIVYALYRSPLVQRWLTRIGYEVDPTSPGRDGYSSFHFCKQYADPRLMRVLYFNAIHKVLSSEQGERDVIEIIDEGLRRIRNVSSKDYEKSNNLASVNESNRQRALVTGEQIISFNTYQQALVSEIRRIKSTDPDKLIIIILRCYLEHFYYRMGHNAEFDRYETYKDYEEYQDLTDGFTFLLFSQNLLSMKWEADLADRYKDMVLSLYLTLLSNKLLQKYKTPPEGGNVPRDYVCPLKFIPFGLRKDFRESAKQVIKTLRRSSSHKYDSRSDVNTSFGLHDTHPEIVEELRVRRVVQYVQEAMNTFLDLQPLKGTLLIERTLQVIGETMQKTEKGTEDMLTPLLTSCIPPALVNELQNITCQYLSTSRASVQRRMEASNKTELFKRIQHELEVLLTIIQPISICMTNRAEEILIKKGKDELQKVGNEVFRNRLSKNMDIACERVVDVRRFHFSEKSWLFKILSRKMLFNLESILKFSTTEKSLNLKEFLPLKFVIGFIIQHYSSYAEDMMTALQDMENIIKNQNLSLDSTRTKLGTAFSSCWKALDGIFPSTQEEKHPYFEFQEISHLFKSSKGHNWFTPEETNTLLEVVKAQTHHLPSSSSHSKNPDKHSSRKPQKSAKKADQPAETVTIQQCIDDPSYRAALLSASTRLPKRLEQKVAVLLNHKLLFLIDRIKHVKAIFEEDDRKVKSWWVQKDTATENTIYFMARRFYDELDTRAALEILFYDCMKLLERKDLDILWVKLNCLFTGPNMRDALPQGNPAMEAAGVLLGCPDVLSEVMGKLLELVDDLEVLEVLWKGWKTLKPVAVEDFTLEKLKEKDPESVIVLEKSERWRNYLSLLAFS